MIRDDDRAAPDEVELEPGDLTQPLEDFAAVPDEMHLEPAAEGSSGTEERAAAVHLEETALAFDWVARAEWFEQEAAHEPDPKRKCRTLVLASELWAMTGNLEQARRTAERAAKLQAPLAQRQARQLAAAADRLTARPSSAGPSSRLPPSPQGPAELSSPAPQNSPAAQCSALAAEAGTATSPAVRAHTSFFCAEVARVKLGDTAAALRHWENGAKHAPLDPRPLLFKLAKQIGPSARPPSLRWPDDLGLTPLREATQTLGILRGDPRAPDDAAPRSTAAAAFVEASRALAASDRAGAAEALSRLTESPEFARPARWLAAALLAQAPGSRAAAIKLLTGLLSESGSAAALRRVLAARALELGDAEAARVALEQDRADDEANLAFTATDHIAVGALCGTGVDLLEPWLQQAAKQDDLRPLVWAVASTLGHDRTPPVGTGLDAALLTLGETLGDPRTPEEFEAALGTVSDRVPDHPLLQLVRLELALEHRNVEQLAEALVAGPRARSREQEHQAHYAAALLHERFGEVTAADRHYGRALSSEHFGEAAARALMTRLPKERTAKLLSALAESSRDPERRVLLLLEAVLREGPNEKGAVVCQRAFELDPSFPWVAALGEACLHRTPDPSARAQWVERQRQQASDGFELALWRVRESWLTQDTAQRSAALRAAAEARPTDLALALLLEKHERPSAIERANTRMRLAPHQTDAVTATQLHLEAAWAYESASDARSAAEAAERAAPKQPLAQLCSFRTAPGHPAARQLEQRLQEEIATATTPEHRAELYSRLADFLGRDGKPERQLQALAQAVEHAPSHLPTLVELEARALGAADPQHVLLASTLLAGVLPAEDAAAHALLAARFERLENGWSAAYPLLRHAHRGPETSGYVARQLLSHSRALGDVPMAYEMTRLLITRAIEPLDRAILQLRAAEFARQLNRASDSLQHTRQALQVHPGYLPALSQFVQLSLEAEQWAPAAQALESLAQHSRVLPHQVEHWLAAAELWLDRIGDRERGLRALERAHELDPTHDQVFTRLERLYQDTRAFVKLEQALDRRIRLARDRDDLASLHLSKSRALVATGNTQQARESLLAVIRISPENVDALTSLAELAERDGDALSAEHALLQLVRLNPDPEVQADVYTRLAALYQGALSNPKRALRCTQEVLRRRPDDVRAFDAMLSAYVDTGQTERAIELLEKRQAEAGNAERKLELQLRLAELLARDPAYQGAAEQAHAQLLTDWPQEPLVVQASARYYIATGRTAFVQDWCGRVLGQLRSSLEAGNFDTAPSKTALVLAEALGDDVVRDLVGCTRDLLEARPATFAGAMGSAMSRHLDGLLAPSGISSALRILLTQTRGILDQALELNLAPLAPRRVGSERVRTAFEVKARAMSAGMPELFTTSVEPTLALVTGSPSRVVLGSYWIEEAPPGALDFVAWRCLKSDQARVGLFTQLDHERLYTVLLAFLSCFIEVRVAPPDPTLFQTTRQRVTQRLSQTLDDDLPVLALEVLTQLREAEPDLSDAVCRWVNRSALLATGDPRSALIALDVLERGRRPTPELTDTKGLLRSPQALDLLSMLHDDAFIQAYRRSR